MKVIRKLVLVKIGESTINREIVPVFSFGSIEGPYWNEEYPQQEFDAEEEALEYAYKKEKYAQWLIIPMIKFDNSNN